jgi:hypothetical protein
VNHLHKKTYPIAQNWLKSSNIVYYGFGFLHCSIFSTHLNWVHSVIQVSGTEFCVSFKRFPFYAWDFSFSISVWLFVYRPLMIVYYEYACYGFYFSYFSARIIKNKTFEISIFRKKNKNSIQRIQNTNFFERIG